MVQLLADDIRTRDVLEWTGLHLFHFRGSSCSQKTRIVLSLKGCPWTSHEVDLRTNENFEPYYLGINPRGLVPTLVMDGAVHIESNDIIALIDACFPEPRLIPDGMESRVAELLRHEDDLHLDLRTLSFRFMFPQIKEPKSKGALARYRVGGSGTVGGKPDAKKAREIDFWETAGREGLTDAAVRASVQRFQVALSDLDQRLADAPYLLGPSLSVLDVAWFIYVERLRWCGYPIGRLHPRVRDWHQGLSSRPAFAREVTMPDQIRTAAKDHHRKLEAAGRTLVDVSGL